MSCIEYIFKIQDNIYRITGHEKTIIEVAIHEFSDEMKGDLKPAIVLSVDGVESDKIIYANSIQARDNLVNCHYPYFIQAFHDEIKQAYLSITSIESIKS